MKVLKNIVTAILIILLTVSIAGLVITKTLSSTLLNEAYIFKMLKESNYYDNLYNEVQSNFKNYIGPSGLDESVLTDVCTADDIQRDTEIILGNIYEGTNNEVNADFLRENLTNKINAYILEQGGRITPTVQTSVNQFIDEICQEYVNTLSHNDYEKQINDAYQKVSKIVKTANTALPVAAAVIIILLILITIKDVVLAIPNVGISITSSGILIAVMNYIIKANVKIENIKILNDSVSAAIQNIITDILQKITQTGYIFAVIGIVLIILGNAIIVANNKKHKKKLEH